MATIPTTIIHFSDIYEKDEGTVTYENGTLKGSDEMNEAFARDWLSVGYTAEEFVEKFSDWNNGHLWTKAETAAGTNAEAE